MISLKKEPPTDVQNAEKQTMPEVLLGLYSFFKMCSPFFPWGCSFFLNLECTCNLSVSYSQVNRQESESPSEKKLEAAASRGCVVFPVSLRFLAQNL